MTVSMKRAYVPSSPDDGYRVLVDRLWPRGVSKDKIQISEWLKTVAPSDGLRKSFHGGSITWTEFKRRYIAELKANDHDIQRLASVAKEGDLTIVFGAHDQEKNHALVLKEYLKKLGIS